MVERVTSQETLDDIARLVERAKAAGAQRRGISLAYGLPAAKEDENRLAGETVSTAEHDPNWRYMDSLRRVDEFEIKTKVPGGLGEMRVEQFDMKPRREADDAAAELSVDEEPTVVDYVKRSKLIASELGLQGGDRMAMIERGRRRQEEHEADAAEASRRFREIRAKHREVANA